MAAPHTPIRMDVAQPAPGAAAESPTAPDFATFERDQIARDLGRPKEDTTSTAASSPAPEDAGAAPAQPAGREASPPSPPADKKHPNLQDRRQKVDAEVAELKAQIAAAKALREELDLIRRPKDDKPADSSTATAPEEWERYLNHPKAPREEQFDSYPAFMAAMGVFIGRQQHEERATRERLDAESRSRAEATTKKIAGFHERLEQRLAADPSYQEKIDPGLLNGVTPAFALKPDPDGIVRPRPANVLLQECIYSEAGLDLLAHFSTPEGQKEWIKLVDAENPATMLRLFGRIEARFLSDGSTPAAPAPGKPVTSAPEPPTTLGTRPPQSPDRQGAAVKAGDFSAYEAQRIAADLAARGHR